MTHGPCIYFVRAVKSGLIKIGITTNLHSRLASLERHNHQAFRPLFAFGAEPWVEHWLHHRFRSHLARGREWFLPDPEILCFIARLRRLTFARSDEMTRAILDAQFSRFRA